MPGGVCPVGELAMLPVKFLLGKEFVSCQGDGELANESPSCVPQRYASIPPRR